MLSDEKITLGLSNVWTRIYTTSKKNVLDKKPKLYVIS